jgi:hypothetical protein
VACNDKAMLAMDIAQHSSPTAPATVAQMTPRVPSASLAWSGKERTRSKSRMSVGRAIIAGPRSRTVDTIEAPCSGRETGDTNCGAPGRQGHLFMVRLWMHCHRGENRCRCNRQDTVICSRPRPSQASDRRLEQKSMLVASSTVATVVTRLLHTSGLTRPSQGETISETRLRSGRAP